MRRSRALGGAVGAVLALGLGATAGIAGFNATEDNSSNSFSSDTDWTAPRTSRSVFAKSQGGVTGYVRAGGQYYVYSETNDSGNPPAGVSSVESLSSLGTVPLASGSFTAGGLSYNRRSASLTVPAGTGAGPIAFSIKSTDSDGNTRTEGGYSVLVDNTAPTASTVQTANGAAIAGRPEQNDTATLGFSEPIDPHSISSGWDGSALDVVVRVNNNTGFPSRDRLEVWNAANTVQLPLGSIDLGRSDYVGANRTFGATGTKSRLTLSGGTATVVLGTQSGAGTTASSTGTMTWSPSTTAYDRAGNTVTSASVNETGAADREF